MQTQRSVIIITLYTSSMAICCEPICVTNSFLLFTVTSGLNIVKSIQVGEVYLMNSSSTISFAQHIIIDTIYSIITLGYYISVWCFRRKKLNYLLMWKRRQKVSPVMFVCKLVFEVENAEVHCSITTPAAI